MSEQLSGVTRRQLLSMATMGLGGLAFGSWKFNQSVDSAALIGNSLNTKGNYESVVADWSGTPILTVPLPERAHGVAISDKSVTGLTHAVAFARRPGEFFQVFDYLSGEIKHIQLAKPDRYFYGHGVYSSDGRYLLVTEGERHTSQGIIGIYEVELGYKKVDEWADIGIGPHEIIRLPNLGYAIGVGGVHTFGRDALNLNSMEPSLLCLDEQGNMVSRTMLADKKLSIRHLSATQDGKIFCGQQYRGEPDDYPSLIAYQDKTSDLLPLHAEPEQWARFNHYIASIAVIGDHLLATSPPGDCYGIWSISQNRLLELESLEDASGVVAHHNHFYVSSGSGGVIQYSQDGHTQEYKTKIRWDNHWNAIPS